MNTEAKIDKLISKLISMYEKHEWEVLPDRKWIFTLDVALHRIQIISLNVVGIDYSRHKYTLNILNSEGVKIYERSRADENCDLAKLFGLVRTKVLGVHTAIDEMIKEMEKM